MLNIVHVNDSKSLSFQHGLLEYRTGKLPLDSQNQCPRQQGWLEGVTLNSSCVRVFRAVFLDIIEQVWSQKDRRVVLSTDD